ncbi:MAG TPA: GSCFA domain-containing protein, partial [Prolixibacteraceae bacterium]|nr:GSCFA domain-containing protein [Prolixibacteraceae bacterium]
APEDTLDKINSRLKHAVQYLRETDFLFITFGTAWVYQYKTTGKIVSNCHKIPANEFARKRLTVEEIVEVYIRLTAQLREINPGVKIVFTISPIRHWKDGAIENQRSKSTLLLAVDKLRGILAKLSAAIFHPTKLLWTNCVTTVFIIPTCCTLPIWLLISFGKNLKINLLMPKAKKLRGRLKK